MKINERECTFSCRAFKLMAAERRLLDGILRAPAHFSTELLGQHIKKRPEMYLAVSDVEHAIMTLVNADLIHCSSIRISIQSMYPFRSKRTEQFPPSQSSHREIVMGECCKQALW